MRGGITIPRGRRLWFPGAIYHATVRGNHKEEIFKEAQDYYVYMKFLKSVYEKHPFELYSYCLMSNHIHLQIATLDDEIWNIMKSVNWKYSIYFNRKYDQTGHLFQSRYFSEIIDTESYLLQTSKYIHLNPVKAGIVQKPIQYPWSSYGIYMGVVKNSMVTEENILKYFQHGKKDCHKDVDRKRYRDFVECEE